MKEIIHPVYTWIYIVIWEFAVSSEKNWRWRKKNNRLGIISDWWWNEKEKGSEKRRKEKGKRKRRGEETKKRLEWHERLLLLAIQLHFGSITIYVSRKSNTFIENFRCAWTRARAILYTRTCIEISNFFFVLEKKLPPSVLFHLVKSYYFQV